MDSIAKTSLMTAAMRAAETNRPESQGRLFSDPYAELLAGPEGAQLLQKAILAAGDQPAIAVRTAFIDSKIKSALQEGVRQIVILAAGMDTRAYRLDFPPRTCIYELDRKEVLDYKNTKLTNVKTKCERRTLAVDIREEWQEDLIRAGFQAGDRTLWLVEGLLMYLEEADVETLIKRINTLASIGDFMLLDILSRTLLEAPHMKNQLDFLASLGAPWRFGTNDPVGFLKKLRWEATLSQAGDVAPNRWPFPTAPLNVPDVARGYFIEAIRARTSVTPQL